MPHTIFSLEIEVQESDIDIMGHANNVAYVGWMQDVAIAHSDANGWDWQRYQQTGIAWVARSHQIEYLLPAFKGDRILIETWVSAMKKATCTRTYRFLNRQSNGELAKASTRWALIRLEDSMPVRIPGELASCFTVVDG